MRNLLSKLVIGWIAAAVVTAEGGDFAISAEGQPKATIVLGEKPTKSAQFAAYELQHVLKLVTGSELPIATSAPTAGTRIFVGCGSEERFAGEEYAVRFRDGDIYLAGHDHEDFGRVDYAREDTFPELEYAFHSTPYAVYDFLETYCGVRFYDFGDDGIAFRPRPTLSVVPGADIRRAPKMDAFRRVYYDMKPAVSRRDQKLLRFRWRHNVLFGEVNHSVMGIWYRYYKPSVRKPQADCFIESRPDYFAAGYKGRNAPSSIRQLDYPGDPDLPPQLCTSSEGPVEYFADEAVRLARGEQVPCSFASYVRPVKGGPYYYPVQEDDSGSWCQCDRCRKNPRLGNYLLRHFDWVDRIARRVAAKNPSVGVATLAYSDTMQYPKGLTLSPNLSVELCLAPQSWFHPAVYSWQHGAYRDWVENEGSRRPLTLWLYLLNPWAEAQNPHCYHRFFPVSYPHHMGGYMKEFARDGIRGVFIEAATEYHMPELYLSARIADHDETDPESAIAEYYDLYYGAAGPAMKVFSDTLERESFDIANYSENVRRMSPKNSYVYCLHPEQDNWHLGSRERVDRLDALFRAAEAAAATPLEKRRLALYRRRIWDSVLEGRRDFEARAKARAVPVPFTVSARGDFAKARPAAPFRTLSDTPADTEARVALANDAENLYVEFSEAGGAAVAHRGQEAAKNGFECRLSAEYERNFLRVTVAPDGTAKAVRNELQFGGFRVEEPVKIGSVESRADAAGWRVRLAVPLHLVPNHSGRKSRLKGNFIRHRGWEGAESLAWSPLFAAGDSPALYRFGDILLSEATPYGRIAVEPAQWTNAAVTNGVIVIGGKGNACAFQQKPFFPVQPGERVVFDFDARGTMTGGWKPACAAFQLCGNAYSAGSALGEFEVTDEWRHYRITVHATEGSGEKATTCFRPGFAVYNGGLLSVKNLKIALCR